MTKSEANKIRELLETKLGSKLAGYTLSVGNISYGDNSCTVKLELSKIGTNGKVINPERQRYLERCKMYGLKKEWLGKKVIYKGEDLTIMGLNSRARKYPIEVIKNGKPFKYTVLSIIRIYEASK